MEKNGKVDALSCRTDSELDRGGKATYLSLTLFKLGQLQKSSDMGLVSQDTIWIIAL